MGKTVSGRIAAARSSHSRSDRALYPISKATGVATANDPRARSSPSRAPTSGASGTRAHTLVSIKKVRAGASA
jgi:hypothetical protein